MPELPEVETYVRELEPWLRGRRVVDVRVYWPRILARPDVETFIHQIKGARFERFDRRAKYMILGLSPSDALEQSVASQTTLIVHLRMTGRLFVVPPATIADKHTHVVFDLDNGSHLHYQDPRKFGRLWLVTDAAQVLPKLSMEPLGDDFTSQHLAEKVAGRATAIKGLLLDQTIAAGVGNIYADEALYLSGIHPARAGSSLSGAEIQRLHAAIRTVLQRGIDHHGSTLGGSKLVNYRRPGGETGSFQEEFQVYDRKGKTCKRCGTPIQKIVLGQRGTHFCPNCQQMD